MARAILYLRQSDTSGAGQDSLSLDSQESLLRPWAEAEGDTIIAVIREPDRKGWQDETTREGIAEALARAERREYDRLRFYDISRFARSVRIQEHLIYRLAEHGVSVASYREPWVSSPMFRQILGAVAEEQTRTQSAHVQRAMAERARRGLVHPGNPAYGYAWIDGGLVVHPSEAPIITEAFQRFDGGDGLWHIVADFAARGVPTKRGAMWTITTIKRILTNPVYTGDVTYRGEVVAHGAHPPLIDRAVWQRVQTRLATTPVLRQPGHGLSSWCEGLVRHACGTRMYLIPIKGGHRRDGTQRGPYPNFVCGGRRLVPPCAVRPVMLSAPKLERAVRACLAADLSAVVSVDAAVRAAARAAGGDEAARIRRRLAEQRQRSEHRHARARERWLAGREPLAWMDGEDARYETACAAIAAELAQLPAAPDPARYAAIAGVLDGLSDLARLAPGDALGKALRELGEVWVTAESISIRYRGEYARFVPCPRQQPL